MKWDEFEQGWRESTPEQLRDFARTKWGLYIDGYSSDRDWVSDVMHRMKFWLGEHRPELLHIWNEEYELGKKRLANKKRGWLFPYTTAPETQTQARTA